MLKRVWSVLLTLCLSVLLAPETHASEALTRGAMAQYLVDIFGLQYESSMAISFVDVPQDSPYYMAACICYNRGIMGSVIPDVVCFDCDRMITRAEAATLIYRFGLPDAMPETVPPDVLKEQWCYESICAVLAQHIMSVRGNGEFDPHSPAVLGDINSAAIREFWNLPSSPSATGVIQSCSPDGIQVDGYVYVCDVYKIDGYSCVALRPFAEAVGISVSYDGATKTVELSTQESYLPGGTIGELNSRWFPSSGYAVNIDQHISIDGIMVDDDIPMWVINGRTYVQLAALTKQLSFTLVNDVVICTHTSHDFDGTEGSAPTPSAKQSIANADVAIVISACWKAHVGIIKTGPDAWVKLNGVVLTQGVDYTATITLNASHHYVVTVTGIGNYTGTKTVTI